MSTNEPCIINIDGRRAIPVRAIPYVTGWKLAPDAVALQLARRVGAPFPRLTRTFAFHRRAGITTRVLPKEWDSVVAHIEALESELKTQFPEGEGKEPQAYAAWLNNVASKLPAGVFVWVDEFESDYRENFGPSHTSYPRERHGDGEFEYSPMALVEDVLVMVLAGFDQPAKRPPVIFDKALSKAPPPIRPLECGPIDLSSNYKFAKPDWDRWSKLDRARLWKAACLVADIEPPTDPVEEIWYEGQLRGFPAAFHAVWEAVNWDEMMARLPLQGRSGRMLHTVHLADFAIWSLNKGLALPQPMRELAERHKRAIADLSAGINRNTEFTPDDLDRWQNKSLWSDGEMVAMLCGLNPDKASRRDYADHSKKIDDAHEAIFRSIAAEALEVAYLKHGAFDLTSLENAEVIRYFKPADAMRWAETQRAEFPNFPNFPALVQGAQSAFASAAAKEQSAPAIAKPKRESADEALSTEAAEESESEEDWRTAARRMADELFDRDTASGCRDSLIGYSKRVMDEMQKRSIRGSRGIIDNPKTVKRDALQGAQWWQNKRK